MNHVGTASEITTGCGSDADLYRALGPGGNYRDDFYIDRDFYLFNTESGVGLLIIDGSRIHLIDETVAEVLKKASSSEDRDLVRSVLARLGFESERQIDDHAPESMPARAFSLAVAQKCNLGCTYCYASGGDFGGPAKNMGVDVALRAVDRLLDGVPAGDRISIAFLGGEPLVNRAVLVAATDYALEQATRRGVDVQFAITTNGTMITEADGEFFEAYGFAVTVSLDGIAEDHDKLRPYKSGRGSFDRIIERVKPLLSMQDRMQISARVTVTPRNMNLRRTLDHLINLGFHSVGFSPMVSSPTGQDEMSRQDFETMFDQMISCGLEFEHRVMSGESYPFSNMQSALREIHRGTHRPYSCGAGGGYFGVSADGDLSACHRFVGDDAGNMGSIEQGIDQQAQTDWLESRHVHRQQPCQSCWARYLCGGGCHHEVIHRGRIGCDYIRGWLQYTMQAYLRIQATCPGLFEPAAPQPMKTDENPPV